MTHLSSTINSLAAAGNAALCRMCRLGMKYTVRFLFTVCLLQVFHFVIYKAILVYILLVFVFYKHVKQFLKVRCQVGEKDSGNKPTENSEELQSAESFHYSHATRDTEKVQFHNESYLSVVFTWADNPSHTIQFCVICDYLQMQ